VCLNMQSKLMDSLFGAYFQLIFIKQKHMQNVWIMCWRVHGVAPQ